MCLIEQDFLFEDLSVVLPINAYMQHFEMHGGLREICWLNLFCEYASVSFPEHIHISASIKDNRK
jgi:hypothetical protein